MEAQRELIHDSGSLLLGVQPGARPVVMPGGPGARRAWSLFSFSPETHGSSTLELYTPNLQNEEDHRYCSVLLS